MQEIPLRFGFLHFKPDPDFCVLWRSPELFQPMQMYHIEAGRSYLLKS